MAQGSDAADQMTREAIQITESAARLTALGAKNLAALCLAFAKENQKLKGKTNMTRLLRDGKELKVFDVKQNDLKNFAVEAKKYGVLFSVIRDSRDKQGNVDVLTRAEDVSKINRILERMDYAVPIQEQPQEDSPAKKAKPRVQPENKSGERGIGLKAEAAMANSDRISVRKTIEELKHSKIELPTPPIKLKIKEELTK